MLPNTGMNFTPLDELTAEEMNQLVANIEALSDGSGLENASVTPAKRSGGFFIGTITGATLGTTGNKAITGVGFTPKLVRFQTLPTASSGGNNEGHGAMTSSAQYYVANGNDVTGNRGRNSSTSACIGWVPHNSSTPALLASYVSMDADGFTINVTTASSLFNVAYEAYA